MHTRRSLAAALLVYSALACGESYSPARPDADGGAAADDAPASGDAGETAIDCETYAAYVCATPACTPVLTLVSVLGGQARCERAAVAGCRNATGPGSRTTPAMAMACACGGIDCERREGERGEGEPCVTSLQCGRAADGEWLFCDAPSVAGLHEACEVGRCAVARREGDRCDDAPGMCGDRLRCVIVPMIDPDTGAFTNPSLCRVPIDAGEGERCTMPGGERPCEGGLYCASGSVCRPQSAEGERCEDHPLSCEGDLGCVSGVCVDVRRLIGEDCSAPEARCPFLASECVEGRCVDVARSVGEPCETPLDCQLAHECIDHVCARPAICGG